jgi:tripartite-type tricarboxylate transporter receptor subunit TctC
MFKTVLIIVALFILAPFAGPSSFAQGFPRKPLTLVVPYEPGAGTDLVGRLVASAMEKELGTTVIVDNRPGADSRIGAQFVARAAPDGHTFLIGTTAIPSWPGFVKDPGIDGQKDLAPVSLLAEGALAIAAYAKAPFDSVNELIVWSKANPGKLNFATPGAGDPLIYAHRIAVRGGIDMVIVPFKGAASQWAALFRGDVHVAVFSPARAIEFAKEGKTKTLAVSGERRLAELPDTPTMQELGFDGFGNYWYGFFTTARTPRDAIARLSQAAAASVKHEMVSAGMKKLGITPVGSTPEHMGTVLRNYTENFTSIAKAVGVQPQ